MRTMWFDFPTFTEATPLPALLRVGCEGKTIVGSLLNPMFKAFGFTELKCVGKRVQQRVSGTRQDTRPYTVCLRTPMHQKYLDAVAAEQREAADAVARMIGGDTEQEQVGGSTPSCSEYSEVRHRKRGRPVGAKNKPKTGASSESTSTTVTGPKSKRHAADADGTTASSTNTAPGVD